MRATKAYIASLGTTGVLLAGSLLMLAVVSAVVAFDRWPGGSLQTPVQTLVLNEKPASIRVSEASNAPSATPALSRAIVPSRAPVATRPSAGVRTAPLGGVLGEHVRSAPAPAVPAPVDKTVQTVQDTTYPLFDAVANPGTTAGQVADGLQAVTDATGNGLTTVSPDLGATVTEAGQGVATAVKSVPLPGH